MTPIVKGATIGLLCFLTLGISVSVAAATSKTFRQWIQKTFMSQTIYKVTQTKDVSDHKKNQKRATRRYALQINKKKIKKTKNPIYI